MYHRAVESVGPIHHGGVEVRMGNRDRAQPAQRMDQLRQSIIQQRDTVPQHISVSSPYQQCALSDTDPWLHTDAGDTGSLGVHGVAVGAFEPAVGGPLLPLRIYKLPFVGADTARDGRALSLSVLGPALTTDVLNNSRASSIDNLMLGLRSRLRPLLVSPCRVPVVRIHHKRP